MLGTLKDTQGPCTTLILPYNATNRNTSGMGIPFIRLKIQKLGLTDCRLYIDSIIYKHVYLLA